MTMTIKSSLDGLKKGDCSLVVFPLFDSKITGVSAVTIYKKGKIKITYHDGKEKLGMMDPSWMPRMIYEITAYSCEGMMKSETL